MQVNEVPLDPRLDGWVTRITSYWQQHGVAEPDQLRLSTDLVADLRLALGHGATVDSFTEFDPNTFARDLATADGVAIAPSRRAHTFSRAALAVTTLLATAAGVAATLVFIPHPGPPPSQPSSCGIARITENGRTVFSVHAPCDSHVDLDSH